MDDKELSEFGVTCKRCKLDFAIFADEKDIHHWQEGSWIQDVLGYLSLSERELLLSGTCGDCFDEMFPPNPLDN